VDKSREHSQIKQGKVISANLVMNCAVEDTKAEVIKKEYGKRKKFI